MLAGNNSFALNPLWLDFTLSRAMPCLWPSLASKRVEIEMPDETASAKKPIVTPSRFEALLLYFIGYSPTAPFRFAVGFDLTSARYSLNQTYTT